jgi:hypothetical protein
MSSLYILHIPKTAGSSIIANVLSNTQEYGIKSLPNKPPPYNKDLSDYDYIQAHLGTYPIGLIKNLTVGCMLRNPVDRSISNFLWIYEKLLKDNEKYLKYKTVEDKLRYYLFEDTFYFDHRNIQARFICNNPNDDIFNITDYKEWSKNWYLKNENTTFEFAKQQLDSFDFIGTTDNFLAFLKNVEDWFFKNHNIVFKNDISSKILKSNLYQKYTTETLKTNLQQDEIRAIIDNNNIDFGLYNYVKEKNKC